MRILLLFFVGISLQLSAVTRAPLVLRACINNDDSTITLSWTNIADLCGSFSHYTIYGNENAGPYQQIASISNIAITQHTYSVPNLNVDRGYFIRVFHLCDLSDSATSNTIKVDISKPSSTQLDSVSFDVLTQNIIAGWRPNPAPDRMGYRVYKHNGGINDSIGQTSGTSFVVSTNPSNVFDVTLSAFDSCRLFSPISTPHRPAILSAAIDSCKREITVNWSRYQGWSTIDSQALFVNMNKTGFKHHSSLTGTDNQLIFKDFVLGDSICFLIRSYTAAGNKSSSSNVACIESRALEIPTFLYLSQVNVTTNEEIDLSWSTDNSKDLRTFDVLRSNQSGPLASTFQINSGASLNYNFTDATADVQSTFYNYQVDAYNQCNELVLSSNLGRSIFLEILPPATYNSYINWDGGLSSYALEISDFSRSTWNTQEMSATHSTFSSVDSPACYRIRAVENLNSYGQSSFSYSNVVCLEPPLKAYAPNAFRFGSENNRFIIVGTGIDPPKLKL